MSLESFFFVHCVVQMVQNRKKRFMSGCANSTFVLRTHVIVRYRRGQSNAPKLSVKMTAILVDLIVWHGTGIVVKVDVMN